MRAKITGLTRHRHCTGPPRTLARSQERLPHDTVAEVVPVLPTLLRGFVEDIFEKSGVGRRPRVERLVGAGDQACVRVVPILLGDLNDDDQSQFGNGNLTTRFNENKKKLSRG